MANALQLRRGTTTQHSTFTGLAGEVTVDTTKDTVVVHDGSTAGGIPLAKESGLSAKVESLADLGITASAADLNTTDVATLGYVEASKVITADANADVHFGDGEQIMMGESNDLIIYHSGSHSYIHDQGTGNLTVRATNFVVNNSADTQNMIFATDGGDVKLYHAGTLKAKTTTNGFDVSGGLTGVDSISVSDSTSYAKIEMGGPDGAYVDMKAPFSDDYDGRIQYDVGGDGAFIISTNSTNSSPIIIRQQNNEKLRTLDSGVYVTGTTREKDYSLTGTAIDPANGGVQYKTLSGNTTFTESLGNGDSVVLHLSGGASYTVTWPTMTWVGPDGNTEPTLTADDVIVIWQSNATVYGAHVGSAA